MYVYMLMVRRGDQDFMAVCSTLELAKAKSLEFYRHLCFQQELEDTSRGMLWDDSERTGRYMTWARGKGRTQGTNDDVAMQATIERMRVDAPLS